MKALKCFLQTVCWKQSARFTWVSIQTSLIFCPLTKERNSKSIDMVLRKIYYDTFWNATILERSEYHLRPFKFEMFKNQTKLNQNSESREFNSDEHLKPQYHRNTRPIKIYWLIERKMERAGKWNFQICKFYGNYEMLTASKSKTRFASVVFEKLLNKTWDTFTGVFVDFQEISQCRITEN